MWEKLQIFGTKLNSGIWFLLIIKEWGIASSPTSQHICGIKKSSEWIDLVGNPTLSVSCCLMALLGRKKGRAGSHPRAGGGGEGEAEEMDLLISSFPIPVLGEVVP